MAILRNTTIDDSGFIRLPSGTTAQRPASPTVGMCRYNTTNSQNEYYAADGKWRDMSTGLITKDIGLSAAQSASSLEQILESNPTAAEGAYWLTTNSVTYRTYCRFNWLGKDWHWVLIVKVHNRADMASANAAWTNTAVQNDNDFNLNGGSWAKYQSYMSYPFNYVAMDMNGTIPAIMFFNERRTMSQAMALNSVANGAGVAANFTLPQLPNSVRYDNFAFYFQGGPFAVQTGSEPIVQRYGINTWANNSSNANPDIAGIASVARAGARVGMPLDEGGFTFGNTSNAGSDSGFGFGGCAGNSARTWSCGYGEWNTTAVVNTLPGRLWVR
jgi:hypothetical protein